MDAFNYQDDQLLAEQVPCIELAQRWDTPTFVYSASTIKRHWHAFSDPLKHTPHLLCYAVKANSNLAILQFLARLGAGFDVVSVGELERVLTAGGKASQVVFAGVGKQRHEIQRALEVGIKCFNVESISELKLIHEIAQQMQQRAPIAIRVNPNIDAKTHPYISTGLSSNKFGIAIDNALDAYLMANEMPYIDCVGIACHIGSQLTQLSPFLEALQALLQLMTTLKAHHIHLKHCDLGGGLGVRYHDETPPLPHEYIEKIRQAWPNDGVELVLEPGRCLMANAGILLTKVIHLKQQGTKNFAVVDAAMNDLLRPALYQAWHDIIPVQKRAGCPTRYDVVGPVCESGDFLGKDRLLNIKTGDVLAVRTTGAYGFTMSSQYNSRPRAAELLVDHRHVHLARSRERISDLMINEHLLP
jgi:diaminopimelate decarboxylase